MVITNIEVRNIKGITKLVINQNIQPNRPNILVAPNGFGKSSLAAAFNAILGPRLDLKPEMEPSPKNGDPYLSISLSTGTSLFADKSNNSIKASFDIHVVTNPLVPTAKAQRFGKAVTAKASMDIKPTVLVKTIPSRVTFGYRYTSIKKEFGTNGKILMDISALYSDSQFLQKCENRINFHKFELKSYQYVLTDTIQKINGFLNLTSDAIKKLIVENSLFDNFIPDYLLLAELIKNELGFETVDAYLSAWQFIYVRSQMGRNYKKALSYTSYVCKRKEIDQTLFQINPFPNRFKILTKESDNSLIIEWPKAHLISSGQRDILVFIANLIECGFATEKDCILVVDEFFDYLDDANVVVFQYYVSTLIETFRKNKKVIFPILLTHLDPNYLKHFCFNNKRLNVIYLQESNGKISDKMLKLVSKREDPLIKDELDKHYFHYSIDADNVDLKEQFVSLGLNVDWASPLLFEKKIYRECRRYLLQPDDKYDPLAVCFAIRRRIEEIVYNSLADHYREEFLQTHGTTEKLTFAQSQGALIPETYFLLSLIYNHPLHCLGKDDISKPLSMKLDNPSIKIMIMSLWP